VTRDVLVASGSDLNRIESLTLNKGIPSRLKSNPPLYLTVKMLYRVTEAKGERGPWRVSTAAYYYALHDSKRRELLAFHWHPDSEGRKDPHLHIYDAANIIRLLAKVHLPTGRIALEDFLRFLIQELKVKPIRADWEQVFRGTQAAYEQFRSWP
jgi:hypothetical protein